MPAFIPLEGKRFGRLVVLRRDGVAVRNRVRWVCRCDCGTERSFSGGDLRSGDSQSCGCMVSLVKAAARTTHGMSNSRTYQRWVGMIRRCSTPKSKSWTDYGGRGIAVCPEWRASFEAFLADMGERQPNTTLEREDNNGDYTPGNCVWATAIVQQSNKRTNVRVEIDGRTFPTIAQAASFYGLRPVTVRIRISKYGWDIERALKTPLVEQHTPNRFKRRQP